MTRMPGVGVVRLRQRGDRHRALALAVDLRQAMAEGRRSRARGRRAYMGPAAIDDRLQAGRARACARAPVGERLTIVGAAKKDTSR
jgi:hypothetical protein